MIVKKYRSIGAAFEAEFSELDFADNYRVAKVGDAEGLEKYLGQMRDGCCGSVDIVVLIEGRPHLLGCNYGH